MEPVKEPEKKPEKEVEVIPDSNKDTEKVTDGEKSEVIFKELEPLEDKPYDSTPVIYFILMVVPALICYVCYVICYRKKRRARKLAEKEAQN